MTAPGERFVLVTVKIRAVGKRCADWNDSEECPFIRPDWGDCSLFHADLERGDEDEREVIPYLRDARCLALDGPKGRAA